MDSHFMGQLLLSVIVFAPGLILLAVLGFVGLLMLLEKTVLKVRGQTPATGAFLDSEPAQARNPEPGRIVEALKDAVAADATPAQPAEHTLRRVEK